MLVSIIYLLIVVLLLVSMWKVYENAGRQGWEGIIPIYNLYVMLQIINRPWWWLLIMIFVPIANIIFSIIALKEFLEKFGKGIGFTIATIFFPFITFPMLAFGDDQSDRLRKNGKGRIKSYRDRFMWNYVERCQWFIAGKCCSGGGVHGFIDLGKGAFK